jgi:tetratricopeptide (TPR) repeat protein
VKKLKRLLIVLMAFLVLTTGITVNAQSFTHIDEAGGKTTNADSRDAYTVSHKITASSLGLEENFKNLNDVYCADNGEIFLLGGEKSKITVLNSDYTLNRQITVTDQNGKPIKYQGAKGIYFIDGLIYLCDTENSRILVLYEDGRLKETWGAPESSLIPEGFVFQPTRIEKDADGYFYVLSFGCYYGALTYSSDGEFIGFYGSNRVKATALDTLSYLWDLITSNDKKKSQSVKTLPYSFVDFCFDKNGYMITCTGTTSGNGTGQISKISPGGSVILFQRTLDGKFVTSESVNFLETRAISRFNSMRFQNITSVDVDKDGYIYALEKTYGLIYVYDEECNLITAFGGGIGEGVQSGLFKNTTSIALNGEDILVTDGETASLTVFKPNEYGKLIKSAQTLYLAGDYDEAEELWNKVLSLDRSNQLAYKGLAMASYNDGDYEQALEYAETGMDYNVYDLAYQKLFKRFISDNFVWFFIGAIALFVGVMFLLIKMSKREEPIIKNKKLRLALNVPLHPFGTFEELKNKKLWSLPIAAVILLLFYIGKMLETTASGFLFTTVSHRNYNTLFTLAQTIGLVLLWSVVNWLVATLFEGKGRFKEVLAASSYVMIPLTIYSFVRVIVSHFLPLAGLSFMNAVYTIVLIYTAYLLIIAMMSVHEFTFSKFLLTTAVTLFGMLLVVFIGFMIIILLQQFWNFIYAIYMELVFR